MITEEQRAARRRYIGSSDSPAILGVDRFRGPGDIFCEKTGRVDPFEGNADTERGKLLEPVLLDFAEREIGQSFARDQMAVDMAAASPVLAANFDGISTSAGDRFIVEAKTSVNADEWGTPGTDEVPERVLVQVHHAMYVAGPGYRVAHVPVLLPGYKSFDWRMYRVTRNDELCAIIVARAEEFWEKHVKRDVEPSGFTPSLEILKRLRREPNARQEVSRDALEAWIVSRAARLNAEEAEESAKRELLAAMGTAEAGTIDGADVVTYFEQTARFKAKPACEVKSRVLRLTKQSKQLAAPVAAEMEKSS